MIYTKQNFNNGEILTASQLNHIEDGLFEAANLGSENKTDIESLKETVESLAPTTTKAVDLKQYASNFDMDSIGVLLTNAEKCEIFNAYIAGMEYGEYATDDFPEDFWMNLSGFDFTFTPTTKTATSIVGSVTDVNVDSVSDDYTILKVTATRGALSVSHEYEDEVYVSASISATLKVLFTGGVVKTITCGIGFWSSLPYYDDNISGCNIYVPENEETAQFFTETETETETESTSSYDLRTQSIDNQLVALIEEMIERRKAARADETETTEET